MFALIEQLNGVARNVKIFSSKEKAESYGKERIIDIAINPQYDILLNQDHEDDFEVLMTGDFLTANVVISNHVSASSHNMYYFEIVSAEHILDS